MKVILLQKVLGLGDIDEEKEVADGYAHNFLFPRHLAVPASPKIIGELQARQRRVVKESENDLREQQLLAERLDGLEIEIKEKANDKGWLYAAVTPVKIAKTLEKLGFVVEKNKIKSAPIKEIGQYTGLIKLRHGLEAEIVIIISAV